MLSRAGQENLLHIQNTYNKPYDGTNESRHRRLKAIIVDFHGVWDLCIEGNEVHKRCVKGLPPGAKWVGVVAEPHSLSVYYVFEHESFEPVPTGHWIPVEPVVYEDVKG